jgi:hypothetical protein
VLFPFSTSAPITAKTATAVVDLVLGIAIGSLISSVASRSLTTRGGGAAPPAATEPLPDSRRTISEL